MPNKFIPADTTPDAYQMQLAAMRRLGPDGRTRFVFDLNHRMRMAMEDGVRARHPDYSDEEVRLARIRVQLGDKLFQEVYPGVDVRP